jgi:two-component system, LytTR family, response regulator LytT
MKLLIVEDEQLLAKQLRNMVQELEPRAQVVGQTNSIASTVDWLQCHEAPDLVLMDIELADGQCFDIFQQTQIKSPVIFTTAYDEYALKAFKVNSVDYLLKPIQESELQGALHKWKNLRSSSSSADSLAGHQLQHLLTQFQKSTEYRERFLVKQGQKMLSINVRDIAFFCARNTLTYLVTNARQKFVVDLTLDEIETSLHPKDFFRANRQFIVAHEVITAVHNWFNGKLKVELSVALETEIVISREKAPLFKTWLGG